MIVCDYCGFELIEGKTCLKCSKTYCNKCASRQDCVFCQNELVNINIRQRKYGDSVIQWVSSDQGKNFGLAAEFSEFPQIAFKLLRMPLSPSANYDIILFPSKKQSKKFSRKLVKGMPKESLIIGARPEEKTPARSRYTVIGTPDQEKFSVLLDIATTQESALLFLVAFFNGLFGHLKELSLTNERIKKSIAETIFESVGNYNAIYGIKFIVADEFIRSIANNILAKLWWSYAEYLTLKELSNNDSLSTSISTYISYKISIIFDLTRNSGFHWLTDLFNLAGVHADALNNVLSLSESKVLFRIALNKFQRENKNIVKRLSKREDIITALDIFVQNMSNKAVHRSYEEFACATCKNFTEFLSSLKPTYVWLEETYYLAKVADHYQRQIEEQLEPWHPQIGSVDDFIKLLSNIFKKIDEYPEIYPEIPLIAGYMLLQILEYLGEWRRNPKFLNKAFVIGDKLAMALDKMLPEIRQKNPTTPFRYVDVATILTGLANISLKFGKTRKTEIFHDKARLIAKKHDLREIEFLLNWHEFMLRQDYEKLLQTYRMYSSIASSDLLTLEPHFRTVAQLSAGVFERERKFYHYKKAIQSSLELTNDTALSHKTSIFHDLVTGRVLYYVANLFFLIEEAIDQESVDVIEANLRKAKVYAKVLEIEIGLPDTDPASVFVLKTNIVADLLDNRIEDAKGHIQKLKKFVTKSATTRNFLEITKSWCNAVEKNRWRILLETSDSPYENRDPWSNLLVKLIENETKQHLNKQLRLFSKSILFVEGPTEEVVIPLFAKNTGVDLDEVGVGVIALRGSSKGRYHLKVWKEVSENTPLSLFMLLDLDAKEQAKEAVRNGLISKDHCFILSKGSIEDYYPIDVVGDVIETLCGRRPLEKDLVGNRVAAIDCFLKRNGYTNNWKITVGRRVAQRIGRTQLNPEIRKIIKRVISLS